MSKVKEKELTEQTDCGTIRDTESTAKKTRKKSTSDRLKEVKAERERPPMFNPGRFNIKEEAGYHYRIVSDREYDYCVSRGYEADPNYADSNRSQDPSKIGSARVSLGGADVGTVMRIKQEWYDADQKAKYEKDKEKQGELLKPISENPNITGTLSVKAEKKNIDIQDL
jgi:hypothetical protein